MQEALFRDRGLVCDHCGKPSADHTYHQVPVYDGETGADWGINYYCTKCYKRMKDKDND